MPNVLRRAAVAVAGAAASIATVSVPAAHATTAPVAHTTTAPVYPNSIWAGYWSVSSKHVTEAFAQFKVPAVDCSKSRGKASYMASMWAGIGGVPNGGYGAGNGKAAWLEQDGITVYCANKKPKTRPVYRPFWEVVPPVVKSNDPGAVYYKSASVQPGDEITAVVVPPGTTEAAVANAWTFGVTDYNFTTGKVTTWTYHDPNVPKGDYGLSAEAIEEQAGQGGMKRKPGKQPVAPGAFLACSELPDKTEDVFPEGICPCGADLADACDLVVRYSHQVTYLPEARAVTVLRDRHECNAPAAAGTSRTLRQRRRARRAR